MFAINSPNHFPGGLRHYWLGVGYQGYLNTWGALNKRSNFGFFVGIPETCDLWFIESEWRPELTNQPTYPPIQHPNSPASPTSLPFPPVSNKIPNLSVFKAFLAEGKFSTTIKCKNHEKLDCLWIRQYLSYVRDVTTSRQCRHCSEIKQSHSLLMTL